MQQLYFEDIGLHEQKASPEYLVTKEEIIEYARKWDPQPFHIDEEKAGLSPFGGLIASASHITAISFWLLNRAGKGIAAISGLGWDRMRLPNPVRPGDRLSLTMECIEKRPSKTSLARGIVLHSVVVRNQDGVPVSTFETATLVERTPLPVEPQSR